MNVPYTVQNWSPIRNFGTPRKSSASLNFYAFGIRNNRTISIYKKL